MASILSMKKKSSNQPLLWLFKLAIHLMALIPLFYAYTQAISDHAGGDPVEYIIHFTGIGALNIILITLLISPLTRITKQPLLMKVRRLVGLYAFLYASCHLLNFLAFEIQFNLALFFEEIIKRPYIVIGAVSFLLLSALAVTSFEKIKRKMGKKWQSLHNLIYLIALLVIWHFYWSVKSDVYSPLFYLALTVILLALRMKKIKRIFSK